MAKNLLSFLFKQRRKERQTFVTSDGTNKKVILTGGAEDSGAYNIVVTSDDTVAHTINIYDSDGTNDDFFYQVTIPAGAGQSAAVPAVTLIQSGLLPGLLLDGNGNYLYDLPTGSYLKAALASGSMTAGKTMIFKSNRADF